jgi:hypothetical protein
MIGHFYWLPGDCTDIKGDGHRRIILEMNVMYPMMPGYYIKQISDDLIEYGVTNYYESDRRKESVELTPRLTYNIKTKEIVSPDAFGQITEFKCMYWEEVDQWNMVTDVGLRTCGTRAKYVN